MDRLDGKEQASRKERFARLNHDCMAMHIWMNFLPEDDEMKLEDLKKMSTFDLTALYNEHAAKQVKRMESRAKLEERTAQLLRDAGKLEEGGEDENEVSSAAPQKGKKSKTPKPPVEAPTTDEEGTADMATKKTTKAATKKTATPKAAPKEKPAKKEAGKRGAPLTNLTYTAISEKSKNFNPGGNKLQASSARGVIFAAIQKKEAGITRTKLEEQFPDQNVKSALDVLIKFGFIKAE